MFTALNTTVLMHRSGAYFVADLFRNKDNVVFAKRGTTYYRIKERGCTSVDKLYWTPDSLQLAPVRYNMGNMVYDGEPA